MPRTRPRDFDFNIHVDPSCLSATQLIDDDYEDYDEPSMNSPSDQDTPLASRAANDVEMNEKQELRLHEAHDAETSLNNDQDDSVLTEPGQSLAGHTAQDDDGGVQVREPIIQGAPDSGESSVEQLLQETMDELQDLQVQQEEVARSDAESEAGLKTDLEAEVQGEEAAWQTEQEDRPRPVEETSFQEVDDNESEGAGETGSRRSSLFSPDRRTSGRTNALIQAAARAVVDQIERQRHEEPLHGRESVLSSAINDHSHVDGTETSFITEEGPVEEEGDDEESRRSRDSFVSDSRSSRYSCDNLADGSRHDSFDYEDRRGGSSSHSHHEADSEVFSDRSARSSLGSFGGGPVEPKKEEKAGDVDSYPLEQDQTMTECTRSPRISDFSQYEREEFVPTIRGVPRPPFRTPSDVRAMQLSSPTPSSTHNGGASGSPRSSKRHYMPTISRLGSPSVSARQSYSPKSRTTPSRLKPRKDTPPLVLLHATILPLRWPWGDVLEAAPTQSLTDEAKNLRDAWRFLHDRLGDTVCERGILLPHPQGDYEILEERLLEALELPLRRRARILECGHYLGPSNMMSLLEDEEGEDSEVEDEDGAGLGPGVSVRKGSPFVTRRRTSVATSQAQSHQDQTHWCKTCHHDIRYESLGPGKVFRVKVYASNGLMKAGAWAACWKEMERVDVEIEPIVHSNLQQELERLAIEQQEAADREADELHAAEAVALADRLLGVDDQPVDQLPSPLPSPSVASPPHLPAASPIDVAQVPSSPSPRSSVSRHDQLEERRIRDDARLREIYGRTPHPPQSPATEQPATAADQSSYMESDSPSEPSPSEEAAARRDARRAAAPSYPPTSPLQSATLPELLLEAARVMLQDKKNVALVLLSLLVLFLAVKPPAVRDDLHLRDWDGELAKREANGEPTVPVAPDLEFDVDTMINGASNVRQYYSIVDEATAPSNDAGDIEGTYSPDGIDDPCQQQQLSGSPGVNHGDSASREVVRVFETVTETETVKAFVTETEVVTKPTDTGPAEEESFARMDEDPEVVEHLSLHGAEDAETEHQTKGQDLPDASAAHSPIDPQHVSSSVDIDADGPTDREL